MKINKKDLVQTLLKQIETDFETLKAAALATYEDATHEESKAENEYDTRGLEASYLAGAQGKRLADLEEVYAAYKLLPIKDYGPNDEISIGALVEIKSTDTPKKLKVFLVPKGGGQHISLNNELIQVVASTSPLGEALLGLKCGDDAIVENGSKEFEYEIMAVW